MKDRWRWASTLFFSALVMAPLATSTLASDPPDSEVNPVTGHIETTDSFSDEGLINVRHTDNPGGSLRKNVILLSAASQDDLDPRVTISDDGDTLVAWWRDGDNDVVLCRKRSYSSGSWSSEWQVSEVDENGRNPEIVNDDSRAWVAYEIDDPNGTSIGVNAIADEPNPIGSLAILRTTSWAGDVGVLIDFDSGHLWVTWVDDDSFIGWSEFDYSSNTWPSPSYEAYEGDKVENARESIRTTVLGD